VAAQSSHQPTREFAHLSAPNRPIVVGLLISLPLSTLRSCQCRLMSRNRCWVR
jgi:hypothetical protein